MQARPFRLTWFCRSRGGARFAGENCSGRASGAATRFPLRTGNIGEVAEGEARSSCAGNRETMARCDGGAGATAVRPRHGVSGQPSFTGLPCDGDDRSRSPLPKRFSTSTSMLSCMMAGSICSSVRARHMARRSTRSSCQAYWFFDGLAFRMPWHRCVRGHRRLLRNSTGDQINPNGIARRVAFGNRAVAVLFEHQRGCR